ncbi:MAG: hypothetical protein RIQ89_2020 [Bacteroidota bacterium]|jgi:hypothetical protein
MLKLKPSCEHCSSPLPYNATNAMICSFECTFCNDCVQNILANVCPNCGGGFERRPIRPLSFLTNYPVAALPHHQPIDLVSFSELKEKNKSIPPNLR